MSVVYFIQAGAGGPIKIGTAQDIAKRVASLQTGCPEMLIVLATAPGGAVEERLLHGKLRESRVRGEWFKPDPRVLDAVTDARAGKLPRPEVVRSASAPFSPIKNIVGMIRLRPLVLGWSPQALAAAAGVAVSALDGLAADDWNPDLKTLLALEAVVLAQPEQAKAA